MGFATILAKCQIGTGLSISGRGNRGDLLRVALAAGRKSSMVFFMVWAHANRANHMSRVAVVRVVAPRKAAGTLRKSNFHGHLSEEANHGPNIEGMVDKGFHLGSCLRIPDIKVYGACVSPPGIVNDPRWGSKANTVFVDRREEDERSIL